jgi:hypothetical protein
MNWAYGGHFDDRFVEIAHWLTTGDGYSDPIIEPG